MGAKWIQNEMVEMFELLKDGYTDKEVADILNIKHKSNRTVGSIQKQREVVDNFDKYLGKFKDTNYDVGNRDNIMRTISSAVIAGYIDPWS